MRDAERWSVEAFSAGQIQERLVNRGHLELRRKALQNCKDFLRVLAITFRVPINEDRLRAKARRGAQRHGRVDAEFSRAIRGGSYHAPLISLTSDNNGLALERGVEQLLDRNEERVHVDMANQPLHVPRKWLGQRRGDHAR